MQQPLGLSSHFPWKTVLAFWMLGLMGLWVRLSAVPGSPGSSCTLQSSSPAGAWHSEFQRGEMHSQDGRKRVLSSAAPMHSLNLTPTGGQCGTGELRKAQVQAHSGLLAESLTRPMAQPENCVKQDLERPCLICTNSMMSI